MTREQAQELVAKALTEHGPLEGTLGTAAFAQRLAIALEAIGMLQELPPIAVPWATTRTRP